MDYRRVVTSCALAIGLGFSAMGVATPVQALAADIESVNTGDNTGTNDVSVNNDSTSVSNIDTSDTDISNSINSSSNNDDTIISDPDRGFLKNADGSVVTRNVGSVNADEKNVDHYRDSELANNGITGYFDKNTNGSTIEGVTTIGIVPSSASHDPTEYGIDIVVDKKKSERTYNSIQFTDSVRGAPVEFGIHEKTFNEVGTETVIDDSDGNHYRINYKPGNSIYIKPGKQAGIDYVLDKDSLARINNKDNDETVMGWRAHYTESYPDHTFINSGNYGFIFGVNPYPNENRNLSIIKVDGETIVDKVPVKGQYVKTKAHISNLLDEDYTRIMSEVYHPDGSVVDPGVASAILVTPDNINDLKSKMVDDSLRVGDIVFKMPSGALSDSNSVFNSKNFNGITNLSAKFFARPRTQAEFEDVINKKIQENDIYDGTLYYTQTGAGTREIVHNGSKVLIDKQGIARYDHYNYLGNIIVNLDDTRYYDQTFNRIQNEKYDTEYSNSLLPGGKITLKINSLSGKGADPSKSYEDMKVAQDNGLTKRTIVDKYINVARDKGWTVNFDSNNPSEFTVIAPEDANAGDSLYLPVEYKYTNGSTDNHVFYFVVRDSNNVKPEYHAEIGLQGDELVNSPEVIPSSKPNHNMPKSYELVPGEYKDDKGNVWDNVTIDSESGKVSVIVPNSANINGGEILYVPVRVNYVDVLTGEKKSEIVKAQFIARVKHKTEVIFTTEKDIPFDTKEEFDPDLEVGKIKVITEGIVGKKEIKFVQAVQNGVKGIINAQGIFEPGDDKYTLAEKEVTPKIDKVIKIGTKPIEENIIIPHTIEYIVDPSLKPGQEELLDEGMDGEIIVKTSRNPQTGDIVITKEEVYKMQPMKVKIGGYTHTNDIPFDTEIQFDDSLTAGDTKIVTDGIIGKTSTVVTPSKIANMDDMMKIIGEGNFLKHDELHNISNLPNYNAITQYMVDNGYWDSDKIVKTTDEYGNVIEAKYNGQTFEELLNFNSKNHPTGKVLISGKVETKTITKKQNKIIKVGTKTEGTIVDTDEIPFKIRVEKDSSIKKGEWKYKQDENGNDLSGKVGTNKKTWNIVNSKIVDNNPTIEKTNPIDAVILVGDNDFSGEIKHTESIVVPFETEIRYNDQLEAGITNIIQEGENGSYDINYSQNIVNSTPVGSIEKNKANEISAKPKIIEIGTKPKLIENNEKKIITNVPVKIEYVFDNTLDKGVINSGEYTEGSVETIVTNEIINDKIVSHETTKVIPNVQKIIVGTKDYTGNYKYKIKESQKFDTIVEYDDNLPVGEYKIKQAGIIGEIEIEYNQKIINSKAEGNPTIINKQVIKNPTHEIIIIGTKESEKHSHSEKEIEYDIPFTTKIVYDDTIKIGTIETIQEGKEGKRVIKVTENNGNMKDEIISDTPAIEKIIRVGIKSTKSIIEIPMNKEYKYNPELKQGETKIIQNGKNGSIIIETIFDKNTNTFATNKQEEAPITEIIEFGTTTDGIHKYQEKIAYDTKIEEDSSQPNGYYKIKQQGSYGLKETELIIKDSKVIKSTEHNIKNPIDQIIIIGTGGCPMPEPDPDKKNNDKKDSKTEDKKDPKTNDKKDPEVKDKKDPRIEDKKDPKIEDKKDPKTEDKKDNKVEDHNDPKIEDKKDTDIVENKNEYIQNKNIVHSSSLPKTNDVSSTVTPIFASGISAMLIGLLARLRFKNEPSE